MYVGGCWGNAIYMWNDSKTRIYGFKDPWRNGFAEGSVLFDLANHKEEDTIPLYYISNIDYKDDPKDMFFADIELIANIENPKNDYPMNWFKPYLDKPIKELTEKSDGLGVLKIKERNKLRDFIDTLKEMKG